ncbi:unnamed protein product [Vitrella brassicaformis CCMP3155]|uniref:Uncharacterized protein n=2 Tax=Vitrella brassicaformis TaxID=1169539 RepID=A0A0G4EES2_VITBC|nr:unnamed protein product [Vitrella brassicaformis CCMP3155]|eukprot:CEL94186.1 unnamed protein product [Vitrella brassicaformis CCMP3155]
MKRGFLLQHGGRYAEKKLGVDLQTLRSQSSTRATTTTPEVLIIDSTPSCFFSKRAEKVIPGCTVVENEEWEVDILQKLQEMKPSAVVLAMVLDDCCGSEPEDPSFRQQIGGVVSRLHTMVADEGTTAVLVPHNAPVKFVEEFLRKCDLSWKFTAYERTTFHKTSHAPQSCLLQAINNKCCSLKDVPEAHRMYVSTD